MEFNGTFFATIITFILFVILMNKILYLPILNIMEERKNFINENYKSAKETEIQVSELELKKKSQLDEAKDRARDEYNEIINSYKLRRDEIVSEALDVVNNDLENFKNELEIVSNEVKSNLKGSMSELANDIVEKVIGYRSENNHINEDIVNKILWESK